MGTRPEVVGEAFNFSTETPITVLELLDLLRSVTGRGDLEPDVRATAANEIPHQSLSAEKARRLLDWKPRYGHREGLERTVGWYRDFLGS